MSSFQRIIIDCFIDDSGAIQGGRVEFPKPEEGAAKEQPQATATGAIQLDPKSPDFESRRAELKAKGYVYNGRSKTWSPPASETESQDFSNWFGTSNEVPLSKSDPDFESKRQALRAAGFKWNKSKNAWVR